MSFVNFQNKGGWHAVLGLLFQKSNTLLFSLPIDHTVTPSNLFHEKYLLISCSLFF